MYKIDALLKQKRQLFHTNDLALLWQIENPNTLYTAIKRYLQKGILIPIHKGYYATAPLDSIDPVELGLGYLHQYGYLSTETVLSHHGVIFQKSDYMTFVGQVSRKFTIGANSYLVRRMKDIYLFQSAGIISGPNGLKTASLERAVIDLLYFNRRFHFDNRGKINWLKIARMQKEIGYI